MGMNDREVWDKAHEKKIPWQKGDLVWVEIKEGRNKHLRKGKIDGGKTSGMWRIFFEHAFVGERQGTHGWYRETVMFRTEKDWYQQ